MLRSIGVPVIGATALYGDNLGMIIYSTSPDSELKKNHMAISYHKLQEYKASGIVNPIKFCTKVNIDDIFTKVVSVGTLSSLSDASYGVHSGEG